MLHKIALTFLGLFAFIFSVSAALFPTMYWPVSDNTYSFWSSRPDIGFGIYDTRIHNNNCGASIFFPSDVADFNRATWNRVSSSSCVRAIIRIPLINWQQNCPNNSTAMDSSSTFVVGTTYGIIRPGWATLGSYQLNTDPNYMYCQIW